MKKGLFLVMMCLTGCTSVIPPKTTLTLRPGVTMERPEWSCEAKPATLEKLTISEPTGQHVLLIKTRCTFPTTTLTLYSATGMSLATITIGKHETSVTRHVPVDLPIPFDMVIANFMLANLAMETTTPLLPPGWHWETQPDTQTRMLIEEHTPTMVLGYKNTILTTITLPQEHVTMTLTPLSQGH